MLRILLTIVLLVVIWRYEPILLGAVVGVWAVLKMFERWSIKRQLQQVAGRRKWNLDRYLFSTVVPMDEVRRITELPFETLRQQLVDGKLAPSKVLAAYKVRAGQIHLETNCITEAVSFADTLAASLDKYSPEKRRQLPLFGVPVSIKDNFQVDGTLCTGGMLSFVDWSLFGNGRDEPPAGRLDGNHASLVQLLIDAGAVPFVKTNVPQTMISYDCHNYLFGATSHPKDKSRVPGGSSGGEAALISSGGSIIGIGTDVGGSLRIPSGFCGIYTLKPTSGRCAKKGTCPFMPGQTCVPAIAGPLSRDMESLLCLCRLFFQRSHNYDRRCFPSLFDEKVLSNKKPLRIGYIVDAGPKAMSATPACKRAVLETKERLTRLGHELVEFNVDLSEVLVIYIRSVLGDGGNELCRRIGAESVSPSVVLIYLNSILPSFLKYVLSFPIKLLSPNLAKAMHSMAFQNSVGDWWDLVYYVNNWRNDFMSKMESLKLDAIISPGFASPALPHGYPSRASAAALYTFMYNVLDLPAGLVPVSEVTQNDDKELNSNYPGLSVDTFHYWVRRGAQGTVGLPLAVQIASYPFHEEVCLRIMSEIDTDIRANGK